MSEDSSFAIETVTIDPNTFEIGRICIICGLSFKIDSEKDTRQICRECCGRIKYMIYKDGEP